MKVGDRVKTEDGPGLIVDVEKYSRLRQTRYSVKLDNPPSWVDDDGTAYYWEKEIEKV